MKERKKRLPDGWPRHVAHRGVPSLAPENTLASFELARSLGAQAFELDVHLARSGDLVVVHDFGLGRVAARDARVEELTLDELRDLEVGSWFNRAHPERANPAFERERIPTLDEALDAIGPDAFVDVELKTNAGMPRALCRAVAETLARRKLAGAIVSSFNPFALIEYRRHGDEPVGAIYCPYKSVPWAMRHRECLYLSWPDVRKPALETALASPNAEGGRGPTRESVVAWTVDDPAVAAELFARGIDSIVTNRIQDFVR
jgi:glycerophosphoryl diester phosphodiesterase